MYKKALKLLLENHVYNLQDALEETLGNLPDDLKEEKKDIWGSPLKRAEVLDPIELAIVWLSSDIDELFEDI